jgi:hypothetical protein
MHVYGSVKAFKMGEKKQKLFESPFISRFLISSLIITIIFSTFFVLGLGFIVTEKRNAIMATQQKKVLAGKLFLEQIFESSFEDLAIMANSKLFIAACTAMDNDNEMKEYVKDLISNIFNNKSHYFQFRFIDSTGMEKCRAERINGEPVFRQKDQLQNKADRYYFKEAIKLNEGESYISPFDLHIEHGEIEGPYRPMIRARKSG